MLFQLLQFLAVGERGRFALELEEVVAEPVRSAAAAAAATGPSCAKAVVVAAAAAQMTVLAPFAAREVAVGLAAGEAAVVAIACNLDSVKLLISAAFAVTP